MLKGILVVKRNGDAEDIGLVKNGIGVGIERDILEEATCARVQHISMADGSKDILFCLSVFLCGTVKGILLCWHNDIGS